MSETKTTSYTELGYDDPDYALSERVQVVFGEMSHVIKVTQRIKSQLEGETEPEQKDYTTYVQLDTDGHRLWIYFNRRRYWIELADAEIKSEECTGYQKDFDSALESAKGG